MDDSIDGYYRDKVSQRRTNPRGIGQIEESGEEDDRGNNFDAQRYQSIHGNEFSESNRRRRSNLILDNMDEDDVDMRPVDPNDFFRDRNEEWAVDEEEEEDANESLPRSMAVTDNLFAPDNEGEERKAELGFDSIQDEFQLDGDNDVVGRGGPGSVAVTETNRASKRIRHDGDSNDDSDADEGEDKVGDMPANHRAAIINKGARYGSAAIESSGPLQKVDS